MYRGYSYETAVASTALSAEAVDDTGVLSEEIELGGYEGVLIEFKVVFENPATDNFEYEVHVSMDGGTTWVKDEAQGGSVTKSSGATLYKHVHVEKYPDIKILAKSAGATDTPTVTMQSRKYKKLTHG